MRPLELKLAHFGPYRDEAVLDFEALDRLFLVCGPTGAGKTTLFDALTFALYEQTPGTRADLSDQLASHHAPEGAVPRVSLRFSLGTQQWRISRTLRHRVKKQRGEGFREQDAAAHLESLKNGLWETWQGKRSEINLKLVDLVGLSAEEFAKIVVLPQGDFQRFLEATSNDREKMLQKLFPVATYERLVDGLKVKAKDVEEARRRWEDRWQELTARLGTHPDDRPTLEAAWAQALEQAHGAAQAEIEASEALVTLKSLHIDWQELQTKLIEGREWEKKRPRVEADRQKVNRARKARPLVADLDRQEQILTEGRALRAVQDRTKAEFEKVEKALAEVRSRQSMQAVVEARLEGLLKERGLLEAQQKQWASSLALRAEEASAIAAETRARAVLDAAQAALAQVSLPQVPPGPGWDEALAQAEAARALLEIQTRQEQVLSALEAEVQALPGLRAQVEAADRELGLWNQVVEALKAADLAQTLVEGQPCLVCGSVKHPIPATWPQASAEAPARREAALAAQARCRASLAVAQDRHAVLVRQRDEFEVPTQGLEVTRQRLTEAQNQVKTLQAWTTARESAQKALDSRTSEEARARDDWQEANRHKESVAQRRRSLDETVGTDPTPRLETLKLEEIELRRNLEQDKKRAENLGRDHSSLGARVEEQEKQLEVQRLEYARLQESLLAAVAALGWTLEDLKAARMAEVTLKNLEDEVNAYDRETHRLAGETTALEKRLPAGEPPAMTPLVQALEAHRQDRQTQEALAKEKEFALRERDRLEEELREAQREKQALEADFQRLVPLARALDGHNSLNLRLTTWVLVQALEQVARSATQRLATMSGGRYALKVQTQGNDGRRGWGLDLAVVDSYTGQERAVGTLSGGEKFMTSISLALGLADVIQERAGGLKLEAIFIDEGFGTLDDQSLDRAMGILHDLGQHRSVGLISHVAELRQRISSRVEVVKGKGGSWLRLS